MNSPTQPGARRSADGGSPEHWQLLGRIVGYGISRTVVEALLAGRGLLLAGVLGPELFGIWALFRLGLRYLAFAGLGLLRGLELEVSRSSDQSQSGSAEQTLWGKVTAGHTLLLYGVLTALAAMAWAWSSKPLASIIFLGIAISLVLERLWSYGITFLRASGGLRRFAVVELLHAGLQVSLCLLFAMRWGLTGAFVGFTIANLTGIALLADRAPLRPRFEPRRVYRLIKIGFPVGLMGMLTAALATVDRLLVGAVVGLGALGIYAFAVSVSELGVSFAAVVRTVILRDAYRQRESTPAAKTSPFVLDATLSGFATLGPPLAGFFALLLPQLIALFAGDYRSAATVAQLLLFAGLVQGLINLAVLRIVAEGRQGRLPLLSIAVVCLDVFLTLSALSIGLGLEGVAAAALLTRMIHAAAIIIVSKPGVPRLVTVIIGFLAPSIWCAVTVYAISHLLPREDVRTLIVQLLIYAVAVCALSPAILRALVPRQSHRDS